MKNLRWLDACVLVLVLVVPAKSETIDEALERAESAKQRAIDASDREDYTSALAHMAKCLEILRKTEKNAPAGQVKDVFGYFVASETNRTILFCYMGVHKSNITNGISEAWRRRIEDLTPPQEMKGPKDVGVALDWKVQYSYAFLQQCLADYYARKKDYAQKLFSNGEKLRHTLRLRG
ncbi:MAG: hypothetical protein SH850_22290 [Planctomycetaceae bacterium]|nr:hypothetical protein [Planctomycetaceae bacterium]